MADFWIGDMVIILSTGKTGTYEGLFKGKAKIKTPSGFIYTKPGEIEVIPEHEEKNPLETFKIPDPIKLKQVKQIEPLLDLHMEKLNPSMKNASPEMILHYQLRRAKTFLDNTIQRRLFMATIIHGKGQGALKMEIEHLVKNYDEMNYFRTINDGGAMQVFFKY